MTARKAERLRWRKPPLPRAVRELLRDVVLWRDEFKYNRASTIPMDDIVARACRVLGQKYDAIIARARKVRK